MCTEALNYHHQITEYGTQWNFFMTLSAITLFNEIFLRLIKSFTALLISTMLFLVIHESCLTMGLKQWILSDAPRLDFISGNREGVFSLMGYEVLYLSGMMISHFLPRKNDLYRKYITILPQYILSFLFFITLTKLSEFSVGVSRRTANTGYIFWILSLTFLTFIIIFICDVVLRFCINGKAISVDSASLIIKAVNFNGLFFFLFGNVLTGCINLSAKTLLLNEVFGVLIILAYTFVCCGSVVFLYSKNIRLR
jgi:phosphatidylinositol glycan class W